jgi:hypothetical protein
MTYYEADMYPVQLDVEYPEEPRNRLTTFFRLILMIPIVIMAILVSWSAGLLSLATLLMILFRKKYPRWWFDFNLELRRLSARLNAYTSYLRDEYPSTDEEQAVHLEIAYPDAAGQLNRFMPLIKWLLAIPHYVILIILWICTFVVTLIAWFAILIVGRYPRGLFEFVVGVARWGERVNAYVFMLVTDRYPPFRLSP